MSNNQVSSGVYASLSIPGGVIDPAQILSLQSPYNLPQNPNLSLLTNSLNVPPLTVDRLRHFAEEVYALRPNDHLTRLLKILLGEAGAGQWRGRALAARLQSYLNGASFYQLDSFYGDLFGLTRISSEKLSLDPYNNLGTYDDWSLVRMQDASFRNRIERFAKALTLGATPLGMQMLAEAILQSPVKIIETAGNGFGYTRTYDRLHNYGLGTSFLSIGSTWSTFASATYQTMATMSSADPKTNVKSFAVIPSRPISMEEELSIRTVLDVIRPADSSFTIIANSSTSEVPIALRGVYADSSYWHLVESIKPNPIYANLYHLTDMPDVNGYKEVLRPVNSEYQGEEIVYNGDIVGIVGGINPGNDDTITNANATDAITFHDGTTAFYPPNDGIASRSAYITGRVVNDGILQSAPFSSDAMNVSHQTIYNQTGVNVSQTTTTDPQAIYVDGVSLYDLTQTIGSANLIEETTQRFWSTPPKYANDPTVEVVEVRLSDDRLINNFTFDLAHYPHNIQIWGKSSTEQYYSMLYEDTVYDSIPSLLSQAPTQNHDHPQHSAPGHWDSREIYIDPQLLNDIQVRLTRITAGSPPVVQNHTAMNGVANIIATPVPYSLGLRGFTILYDIDEQAALPTSALFTKDALGSSVEWSVRQEPSSNAIDGTLAAWRSSPQPSNDSVVNFYLDTRDANGNPQVIDKMFIDPLYPGPHCSLYYSNSDTADIGTSADFTPLSPPLTSFSGNAAPDPVQGITFDPSSTSFVDVQNVAVQFDPTQSWWTGFSLYPHFASSDANGQFIWGNSEMRLTIEAPDTGGTAAKIKFTTVDGNSAYVPTPFNINDNVIVVIASFPKDTADFVKGVYIFAAANPSGNLFLNTGRSGLAQPIPNPVNDEMPTPNYYIPTQYVTTQPPHWYMGGKSGSVAGNFTLVNTTWVQANATDYAIEMFAQNPASFCQASSYSNAIAGQPTTNSVLRFDPSFITIDNPTGMVGGPGNFWGNLSWRPVSREFVASKGFMHFNPTLAKFWKLEFTNLVPLPINSFHGINRTIRTHQGLPASIVQEPSIDSKTNFGSHPSGADIQVGIPRGALNYTDSTLTPPYVPLTNGAVPPTSAQVVQDLTTRNQQASVAWYWQYQDGSMGQTAPRFVREGEHQYNNVNVTHSNQVGYFAGLNEIQAYRTGMQTIETFVIYDEYFLDDTMILSSSWNRNPSDLNTVGLASFPVVATGQPINLIGNPVSTPSIVGVQYATSQSDAVQLAYDDQFQSGAIRGNYDWTNTLYPHIVGDALTPSVSDSNQVTVTRNINASTGTTTYTPQQQGTIARVPVHPVSYEENLVIPAPGAPNFGGLATSINSTVISGTAVWAAVRLTVNSELSYPLSLEIVDSTTNTVLASTTFFPSAGRVTEESIGAILTTSHGIYAQIVQYSNNSTDSWIVDRFSLYDEGMYWEFSNDRGTTWYRAYDIRNNAHGVMSFPVGNQNLQWRATGTRANVHVNALRMRPLYAQTPTRWPNGTYAGPNVTFSDHQPPIEDDPLFNGWSNPIPQLWYRSNNYAIVSASDVPTGSPYSQSYMEALSTTATTSESVTSAKNAVSVLSEIAVTTEQVVGGVSYNVATADNESSTFNEAVTSTKTPLPVRSNVVTRIVHPIEGA